MQARRFFGLSLAQLFVLCGCVHPLPPASTSAQPRSFPLTRSQPGSGSAFSFVPSRPYNLDFGRGSGLDGLETVSLDAKGDAVVHRSVPGYAFSLRYGKIGTNTWERTNIKLPAE